MNEDEFDNPWLSRDEMLRMIGNPSEKSLADIRSLMATGIGGAPPMPEPEETDAMAEALAHSDDPTKLRRLADWFDSRESDPEAETEVQDDLRRMARRFEEFVAPTAELERVLRILTDEIFTSHAEEPWDMDETETEVLEVIIGWLSER